MWSERTPLNDCPLKRASLEVRRGFIQKVYGILTAQLLLTVVIAAPLSQMKWFVMQNVWLLWVSVFITVGTLCAMSCCEETTRSFPTNYILLFLFTGFEGVVVGFVSAQYTWQSVVLAAGMTAAIFLCMTLYACFTETDFTGYGPYLFGATLALCVFGFTLAIMSSFGVRISWLVMIYNLIGVVIFTLYIVYDTQLIMGEYGGHSCQFEIDEYVFASLSLYLDIINLFMHLLSLFGNRD